MQGEECNEFGLLGVGALNAVRYFSSFNFIALSSIVIAVTPVMRESIALADTCSCRRTHSFKCKRYAAICNCMVIARIGVKVTST